MLRGRPHGASRSGWARRVAAAHCRGGTPLLCGFGLLLLLGLVRLVLLHDELTRQLHTQVQGVGHGGSSASGDQRQDELGLLQLSGDGGDADAGTWDVPGWLARHNVTTDLHRLLAYPHVDECRQCKVCIPQSHVDGLLGNRSSSGSGSSGGLWSWLLPWTWGGEQEGQLHHRRLLLSDDEAGEQQQDVSLQNSTSQTQQAGGSDHQQQQRQRRRRLLAAAPATSAGDGELPLPPGYRPPLNGVKTHKAWLAKQAAGLASNNTHTVPGIEVILDMPDRSFKWQMDSGKIRTCEVCRGCGQHLRPMPKGIKWLGSSFTHDPGASAGWMVMADTPETPPRPAAVKVWCVPVPKPGTRVPAVCKPKEIREQLQLLLALQNIATDCQLDELLPRHWVGPVDGILPGSTGYRVLWDGLWADLAVGVSAENLVHRGVPRVEPAALLDYLQTKLNSTQVVMAAIFDLLFSQCDRHGQNVYLKPDGSLVLIDNDQAYGASWRPCGVDSLFLPGTQKFEVARLGYSYVLKKPEYAPPKAPQQQLDPLSLLDYRCHAPGGKLGTAYPKPVTKCLKRLSRSTPEAIATKFGYPNEAMAAAVQQRARDLLRRGFEWTLQYGWPQNPDPVRYRWAKGCCKMQLKASSSSSSSGAGGGTQQQQQPHTGSGTDEEDALPPSAPGALRRYTCSAWVAPELGWPTGLPLGDPTAVMAWEHNGVDSGSYALAQEYADVPFDQP